MPAAKRRIMPARSIRRWDVTSASAGASLRVEIKNWLARMEYPVRRAKGPFYRCPALSMAVHLWKNRNQSNIRRLQHARPGRLSPERRHHPGQQQERGFLGQADTRALLAVPARGHQEGRNARGGHVSGAPGGSRAVGGSCPHFGAHTRLAALRGAQAMDPPRVAQHLQGPEADMVPPPPRRPGFGRLSAGLRTSRVRRLALERLLGTSGFGDRVQAGRLWVGPDGIGAVSIYPFRRAQTPLDAPGRNG